MVDATAVWSDWQTPDVAPPLNRGEVHAWLAQADHDRRVVDDLWKILPADEQRRAASYRLPQVRDRYICARGQLRILLGKYLLIDPSKVPIAYHRHGKPRLDDILTHRLHFNVSHSGAYVIYGIYHDGEIGIDIECMNPDTPFASIARGFFSVEESEMLSGLPEDLRQQAFFDCWVRKEAWLKAVGAGLSMGLADFGVSFEPGMPPRMLFIRDEKLAQRDWHLAELAAPKGYAVAMVTEGQPSQLSCWQYPGIWVNRAQSR